MRSSFNRHLEILKEKFKPTEIEDIKSHFHLRQNVVSTSYSLAALLWISEICAEPEGIFSAILLWKFIQDINFPGEWGSGPPSQRFAHIKYT